MCRPQVADGTAWGTHAMITNQCQSLGVPSWTEEGLGNQLRVFCYTSDGGPDQKKCKDILRTQTEHLKPTLFFTMNCLQHSNALITKGNLRILDEWSKRVRASGTDTGFTGYFGAVAKLVHVWRDGVQQVWQLSTRMFGNLIAQTHFKKLPPKCIAGRWGSLSLSETFILSSGKHRVTPVIEAVCGIHEVSGMG